MAAALASGDTGASSERTWDVYVTTVMEDHLADETCATSLAPWMQVRLPKTDTLDWKPIEDKVRSSLPLRLISLDLLATIGDEPPLWIDLRSLEGEPMPQGYTPAVRVRSGDYGNFPKMALVYDTEPAEEIDVRTQVPNQIIVLPHSQAPKLILDALQEKLPHRRFELLRPAANQDGCLDPEWEELSEKTQRALPADVLRIKAVRNGISDNLTRLRGLTKAIGAEDSVRKRALRVTGDSESLRQPLLGGC